MGASRSDIAILAPPKTEIRHYALKRELAENAGAIIHH